MLFGLCVTLPRPAEATLGQAHDSVDTDRVRLGARHSAQTAPTHTVDTLILANGGVVREFSRGDGTVFALAWHGPGRPDLRQLLGARFDAFQSSATAPGGRRVRRPLSVNRSDLIVHSAGHPGAFWGFAFIPALTPAGFSMDEFK
jgi:hypothetical protein